LSSWRGKEAFLFRFRFLRTDLGWSFMVSHMLHCATELGFWSVHRVQHQSSSLFGWVVRFDLVEVSWKRKKKEMKQ
jgi:hypothetical protein